MSYMRMFNANRHDYRVKYAKSLREVIGDLLSAVDDLQGDRLFECVSDLYQASADLGRIGSELYDAHLLERSGARDMGCRVPPEDWWCSRLPGHDGPCAARMK